MPGSERIRVGMSKKFAVLGSPVEHSKSPAIHTAAFTFNRTEAEYGRVELSTDLASWVQNLDSSWQGLSLTMPLKEQALALATRADSLAIATGAANTLIRTPDGWDAYNTDVFGIQMAVSGLRFRNVSVIGSGATARSAIVAMQELDKSVAIWARNDSAVRQLAAEFDLGVHEKFYQAAAADLVISTLPSGALDQYLDDLKSEPKGALLDVAYHPWPSKAAVRFSSSGTAISGLEMLLWQAVAQQRIFAGNDIDEPLENEKGMVSAMRAALEMAK